MKIVICVILFTLITYTSYVGILHAENTTTSEIFESSEVISTDDLLRALFDTTEMREVSDTTTTSTISSMNVIELPILEQTTSTLSTLLIDDANLSATSTPRVPPVIEVFAQLFGQDKEIVISDGKQVVQITNNDVNDDHPEYSYPYVVFQTTKAYRTMIGVYNVETHEQTELGFPGVNNMYPQTFQGMVVWQVWNGVDWDIAYARNGQVVPVLNVGFHEIRPSFIDAEHITYTQRKTGGVAEVIVLNVADQTMTRISEGDGSSVAYVEGNGDGSAKWIQFSGGAKREMVYNVDGAFIAVSPNDSEYLLKKYQDQKFSDFEIKENEIKLVGNL